MLSAILKSDTAVEMCKFILNNAQIFQRFETVELKQTVTEQQINQILNVIELNQAKARHLFRWTNLRFIVPELLTFPHSHTLP